MKPTTTILFFGTLILQTYYAAPQFITFKDGKLGVNFMGYHAGVGIGGLAGGGDAAGRLYAEAGTPTGQLARAGLGGQVDEKGRASGGLFAGATAGGNVGAAAGLAGAVNQNNAQGGGFAGAQAGHHIATSGLGGQSSVEGSSGFSYSSDKVINKEKQYAIKPLVETTANFEANINSGIEKSDQPAVLVKEVYVQPKKHHKRVKPLKTYVTYVEQSEVPVSKSLETKIEKRIDTGVEAINVDARASAGTNVDQVYTKQVTVQRNPEFFENIFNIPISALASVRNLLTNTAENTNVSIQKSASVNAETDVPSAKDHSFIKSSQSSAHVSVETPTASKFLGDIFAIPINTLGAVSKFLENNVPARKTIQSADGEVRLRGPARRRASKRVIITNQPQPTEVDEQ